MKKTSYGADSFATTTYYVRDASGSVMGVYQGFSSPSGRYAPPSLQENTIFGSGRIGVFKRTLGRNVTGGYSLYELTDHLGNVRAVIQKTAQGLLALTNKTDYYPFGMPMPNKTTTDGLYRYAFQGQEKDSETGMEAFELRLWDGRLGRWLTTDPYLEFSSPYIGMGNNPINTIDIDGGKIYVTNKAGITYEYKDGNFYDKNGNTYNSGDDDFLNATKNALTKLDYATSSTTINDGKLQRTGIINNLVKSKDIYSIVYKRGSHATGTRTHIDHKATVETPTTKGIIKSPYEITLAHELGHLYSLINGIKNQNEWFNFEGISVDYDEKFASHWENIFRTALNLPLRTHYAILDGKPYEPSNINTGQKIIVGPIMEK